MNDEEKIALVKEVLEIEDETIVAETRLDDLKEFNSMGVLSLIIMFEDEFNKKISGKDIRNCKTIGDILEKMES